MSDCKEKTIYLREEQTNIPENSYEFPKSEEPLRQPTGERGIDRIARLLPDIE